MRMVVALPCRTGQRSRGVRRRRSRGGPRVGMRHQVVDDEMLHDEVPVLDASHVVRVDDETLLRLRAQLAPRESREADRATADRVRVAHGAQHVLRVAAAAEREQQVARTSEVLELLDEDVLVREIVRERRDPGDVVGEREDAEPPIARVRRALAEIDGEVRRGRGAPAIADDEHLRVAIARVAHRVDDAGDLLVRQRADRRVELG